MRLLIVQGKVLHYRVPVFDRLARRLGGGVTVAHSGWPTRTSETTYREVVTPMVGVPRLRWQRGLWRLAEEHDAVMMDFDLRWISSLAVLLRRRLWRGDRRVILWGHGFGRSRKAVLVRPLRALLARAADAAVFYDHPTREKMIRWGVSSERLFVAPNTMHVPNHGFDPGVKRDQFLFVGRLQKRKKVEDLLHAFAAARDRLPEDVTVGIVGSGAYEDALRRVAREQGIGGRVRFYGRVTDPAQLKPIFQRALAYVSPGAVGMSVLHSFAYGVPVITQRGREHGPEVENIDDRRNGYFYDGAVASLARQLVRLAQNPDESVRLGRNGYLHYTQKRTLKHMTDGFERAIAHAISS